VGGLHIDSSKLKLTKLQPRPRPSIFIIFLIFSAFSHEKTGTRAEDGRKRKNRRPSGFPNNKAKIALKLPWLLEPGDEAGPGCEMPNYCAL
jgi:hypothetical protein